MSLIYFYWPALLLRIFFRSTDANHYPRYSFALQETVEPLTGELEPNEGTISCLSFSLFPFLFEDHLYLE